MRDQKTRAIRLIAVIMGLVLTTLPNASVAGDVPASTPTASAAELFIVTMLLAAATSSHSGSGGAAVAVVVAPREAAPGPAPIPRRDRMEEQDASLY
jgi:hypothetical protein